MQGKAKELEKGMTKTKVSAGLEKKKNVDGSELLKEKNMDPSLQPAADTLKTQITKDKFKKGMDKRESKDKLEHRGIMKKGVW